MDELTARIVEEEHDPDALGVQPKEPREDCKIVMGGDTSNPTWAEYRERVAENFRPRLDAIRALIEAEGMVGTCGDEFCNDHYFEFSDGMAISFTWRAWGDLMQAIVGKREGYMHYYMGCLRQPNKPETSDG